MNISIPKQVRRKEKEVFGSTETVRETERERERERKRHNEDIHNN
jgi:hypothetical protein